MPGPDDKETKKQIEKAKKDIQGEVKKLAQKTKKQAKEAKELIEEKEKQKKSKDKSPEAKKKAKELDKKLKDIKLCYKKEADATAKNVTRMLQSYVPSDRDKLPEWQKGMDRWYIDILNREPGFAIGSGVRVNGDISIKDKKAKIDFTWKF